MKHEKLMIEVIGDQSPESLVLTGHKIDDHVIEKVWHTIQRRLASQGYAVDGITMPVIVGITLDSDGLRQAWEDMERFPNLTDQGQIDEWGEPLDKWEACVFAVGPGWVIAIYDRVKPITDNIRHELLHVWESLLGFQWGTLTRGINHRGLLDT